MSQATCPFSAAGRAAVYLVIAYLVIMLVLLRGLPWETGPLPSVQPIVWGGLLLSLLLAFFGITLSFPLGVLLALGRQSKLPAIRVMSVVYIEFIRGVPLISLLFMGQVMLQLFLPDGFPLVDPRPARARRHHPILRGVHCRKRARRPAGRARAASTRPPRR